MGLFLEFFSISCGVFFSLFSLPAFLPFAFFFSFLFLFLFSPLLADLCAIWLCFCVIAFVLL